MKKQFSDKALQDFQLIDQAVKENDEQAFAMLMERYRKPVYHMILKMVRNVDDAEDLTIEAFGKAFKNIDQYAPNFAFSTWLFKIATNNCIDFIRKKRASHVSLDQTMDGEDSLAPSTLIPSDDPDPESYMINKQKIKHMRKVVSRLKPRYRQLVELRYFKEYSYDEIAVELDIPIGTVKAQLFRARELLLNIMNRSLEKP